MSEDSRSFMKKIGRDAMNKRPESLTFHEFLNLKLYMDDKGKALENERYHFNYYEEVGKALEKWHKNEETLQLTEQILVEMSLDVEVEEIDKRYPGFKGDPYYGTFYNYIDEWLKYQESQ